ncbi:uncharacterized protein LOC123014396 isoform X2 [Tribolium madens]|uniref:uncharacterized protein LOC123014396 isoform X2 n=1 Tax=Tribolium madens TaxID=41895 RepID=UPI001CF732E6|nr:uncharacterized protein LOC123014396 isoform X2 [Tribolium madens]
MARSLWLVLVVSAGLADAQEALCYGSGSIALSVILSIVFTAVLLAALYYLWGKYRKRKELILETDPEKGKGGDYAFDNPAFKDPGLTPIGKLEKEKNDAKTKWTQWSPLTALTTKSEKKKTLDDSAIDGNSVKVVALRSHDFTGLGFNICGNMKEGIYIKDVLHRGPASESGKLNPGDRINSVTISFEHMVYEDALTILSYASPYEVIIEARGGKTFQTSGQGAQPTHPVYRSSSCTDLFQVGNTAKRKLFGTEDHSGSLSSNYSSLQKSRSNMTTLERKESESPKNRPRKKTQMSPEQLKTQLEQRISSDHQQNSKKPPKVEMEVQKTENKLHKFGVRVLPAEKSPKSAELSQNENNLNLEKLPLGLDEVDKKPQVKKRERKVTPEKLEVFDRDHANNSSGIKRDVNGIPQEIPNYMMNAAVAARSNRKSSVKDEELDKTPKKTKGKAPAPPEEKLFKSNFDEIQPVDDFEEVIPKSSQDDLVEEIEVELRNKTTVKDYNSDSDLETDNHSSVNTIELNSSDITIHHAEDTEGCQNRRTASTGDLTKIQRTRKSSTGTLERAQSLDITDTSIPTLKRKGRIEDDFMASEEDIFGKVVMSKEPRLSLMLDGLNTFQRNRLKKSTEWGNLEDAILKLNQEDESDSKNDLDLSGKTEEIDAVVNRINEIKRESLEIQPPIKEETPPKPEKKIKNQIWPFETKSNGSAIIDDNPRLASVEKRQRKPPILDPVLPEAKITKPAVPEKKDFLLSKKIPSYVPEPEEEPVTSDETKKEMLNAIDLTRNFIFTEKIACSQDDDDTNVSDDIKVSRHSLGSLERPKSDDAKINVSNVTVNNLRSQNEENLHSLEIDTTEPELYTTALDSTIKPEPETPRVTISTPDIIKNVTIAEAINKLNNDVMVQGPSSLTLEIPNEPEVKDNRFMVDVKKEDSNDDDSSKSTSLTYITEIQVLTPTNSTTTNISEIEIIPNVNTNGKSLDLEHEFEDYVRNFESNVKTFESNIQKFENHHSKPIIITENDAEKELHKIQEIAEEQLKKLPEMRFTTSSYESKLPEKRQSQIELLRSNFEKSPPRVKPDTPKSRIPIATTAKTPPTSPERRDSRNLDMENDKDILELMSSTVHSTPKMKPPKNVTVTSIRSNSKIPSGLPVLGGRPTVPPRKQEEEHVVQVSTNGGVESSFKQWVFNPTDSVTNIVVAESKQQK